MDASSTHNVVDLGDGDKPSIEHLLGTPVSATQKVYIALFTPGKEPDSQARADAAREIDSIFDAGAAHARQNGVTEVEIDEVVDQAMGAIRRRNAQ